MIKKEEKQKEPASTIKTSKSLEKTSTDKKVKQDTNSAQVEKVTVNVTLPTAEEMLEAGVQFGHATKRWNPKMKDFIFGSKSNIHIIDVIQTSEALAETVQFLGEAASKGNILFVGTKNQASDIVRDAAIKAGAFFVDQRWAGGLLTNFDVVKRSLNKLKSLEKQFSEGVEGRTKFEVSQMKKEWQRLDRLYSGIKTMESKPTAAVIIDVNYEKGALRECRRLGIPVVALVDTNVDPESVNYPIPSNDDAISVIQMMMDIFAEAVLQGNKGKGVSHNLVDYNEVEVKITKTEEEEQKKELIETVSTTEEKIIRVPAKKVSRSKAGNGKGGILERVQKEKEATSRQARGKNK